MLRHVSSWALGGVIIAPLQTHWLIGGKTECCVSALRHVGIISVSLAQEAAKIFISFPGSRHNVPVLLQIATFFSNNLDFFTSSGYSPRGSTLALNPLQAESMLANKKKAAAYISAVKKVSV